MQQTFISLQTIQQTFFSDSILSWEHACTECAWLNFSVIASVDSEVICHQIKYPQRVEFLSATGTSINVLLICIIYLHEGNSYPISFQLLSFCTASDKTELQVVMSDEGESIKLPSTFGSVASLAPDL